ncbi:low-density lipoprotein receptor-related protein 2, partial [Biomphalaria glabrata]
PKEELSKNSTPTAQISTTINDKTTRSCISSEWTCGTGECIDIGHRCDGTKQCTDTSDEWKCC